MSEPRASLIGLPFPVEAWDLSIAVDPVTRAHGQRGEVGSTSVRVGRGHSEVAFLLIYYELNGVIDVSVPRVPRGPGVWARSVMMPPELWSRVRGLALEAWAAAEQR
jgi:hypothetical protein